MKETSREPKYPWCTGAPRPVLLSCVDSGDHFITYYLAPIVAESGTGILQFHNVREVSQTVVNDEENKLLLPPYNLLRDSISTFDGATYVFFHNEYFRIVGDLIDERLGGVDNSMNLRRLLNPEMDRY